MIVMKVNPLLRNTTLKQYQQNVSMLIEQFRNAGALVPMENIYGVEAIRNAVKSIYLDGDYICTPSGTTDAIILKTLQYGGFGVKALNILTRAGGSL